MTAVAVTGSLIVAQQHAFASVNVVPDYTESVIGTVYAVAQVGDRTIIGGDFTTVGGLARRNAAAIKADGRVDPTFDPSPDGIVYAVAVSTDASRVFLGGVFQNAGGAPRANLAAVDPVTGAAQADWVANTDADVMTLAVKGTRLYLGGRFTTINTARYRRLAAVDTVTARPYTGFIPWPNWTVRAITVSPDGTKVYATGGFTAMGATPRNGVAEVLASTGAATAFDASDAGVGLCIALSPDGTRLFFSTPNNVLWAYDLVAGPATPVWSVKTGGDTQAVVASSTEVYFGGHFGQLTTFKVKRSALASVNLADGTPTAWDPNPLNWGMGVWALATTPDKLLVGGDFHQIDTKFRRGFARFSGTP